jgi:hypothetical protein
MHPGEAIKPTCSPTVHVPEANAFPCLTDRLLGQTVTAPAWPPWSRPDRRSQFHGGPARVPAKPPSRRLVRGDRRSGGPHQRANRDANAQHLTHRISPIFRAKKLQRRVRFAAADCRMSIFRRKNDRTFGHTGGESLRPGPANSRRAQSNMWPKRTALVAR